MKIISNSLDGWTLEIMCKACTSLLEVGAEDVRCSNARRDYRYKMDYDYHVVCPVCDSRCQLDNLPKPVQVKAMNKKPDPRDDEHGYDDLLDPPPNRDRGYY